MYAVIDIGSNTIRLVIYKIENHQIRALLNKKSPAGLAGYINKNRCLKKSGIRKAVGVLREFREILEHMTIREVFPFATASLRNINNAPEVLDAIKKECGFDVRILSGEEEAVFDYYGSLQAMEMDCGLLCDIGGGSTEIVTYRDHAIHTAVSLPIGSLNLYQNFVKSILPRKKELEALRQHVRKSLESLPDLKYPVTDLCAIGGSARAALQMVRSAAREEDSLSYPPQRLEDFLTEAVEVPEEFARRLLKTAPERIHTFLPGAAVLLTVAEYYHIKRILTVPYGVREGYLYYLLEQRGEIHGK